MRSYLREGLALASIVGAVWVALDVTRIVHLVLCP